MVQRFFLLGVVGVSFGIGALGCDPTSAPQSGGQTGGVTSGCLPVASIALEPTEKSPLGFSAADALAAVGQGYTGPLSWAKGGETEVTLVVQQDGAVHYLDREWRDDDGAKTLEAKPEECPDVVEIPITLGFVTNDGAFDETWHASLLAETETMATLSMGIDLDALHGTYVVTEVDPASFDDISASLDLALSSSGASGKIGGQGSKADAEIASAQLFDIASF